MLRFVLHLSLANGTVLCTFRNRTIAFDFTCNPSGTETVATDGQRSISASSIIFRRSLKQHRTRNIL
uniref:Putative secreted peptide n=1 Tax=Anopheles braziliensis TaxID=58242 RepID=A0A2M3ZWU6_9DIPT